MTRAQVIKDLQRRYAAALNAGRNKSASIIFAEMKGLMLRQIKSENRQKQRSVA